jgi:predicted nuclease with TOPRIM domain
MENHEELAERLEEAIERRDLLASEAQRLKGRLEQAKETLAAVEAEAKKKGINPTKIDQTIIQLEKRLEDGVKGLERQIEEAEEAMKQFEGDSDEVVC